jgi:SAM-dependent methyltransferase
MGNQPRSFLPAAGHDWLLPLYDPVLFLLGGDSARQDLVEQAEIRRGFRILDIGCGTGSLVALISRLHPDAEVVGLDPDPKALARAKRKARRAGTSARFDQGCSDELSYPGAAFDRVFSSFMLHHLGSDEKRRTLKEVCRVLEPNGSLPVLDFVGTEARSDGLMARWLHSRDHLRGNLDGGLLALMREAGFADAREVDHRTTILGRIAFYCAAAPS